LNVPDKGYSRQAPFPLNYIYTFFMTTIVANVLFWWRPYVEVILQCHC